MSSGDINERQRKCREQYNTISKEFRNVLIKVDAIEAPTKKKQKKSKKNAEASNQSTQETAASVRAACKDLAGTISDVLKKLGDDGDAPGPSGCPPTDS